MSFINKNNADPENKLVWLTPVMSPGRWGTGLGLHLARPRPSIHTEVRGRGEAGPSWTQQPRLSFEARGGGVKSRCELKGRGEAQGSHLVGGRGHLKEGAARLGEGAGGLKGKMAQALPWPAASWLSTLAWIPCPDILQVLGMVEGRGPPE